MDANQNPHPGDNSGSGSESREEAVELREADFMGLAGDIADITAAGKPLSGGLRALAVEAPSRKLRRGLLAVADRLDSGQPLAEVLATRISGMPSHLTGLVEAGLKAGCLDRVLQQSLIYNLRSSALRRRVKMCLAYPLILIGMAASLVMFLMVALVPGFKSIFEDFGTELPILTSFVIGVGAFLASSGLWLVLGAMFFGGGIWLVLRLFLGRSVTRRIICGIPLIGSVLRASALMEYCHLLAVLIESQMPLPDALRYAAGGVHDADLAAASVKLSGAVAGGQPFAWTAASLPQFPAIFSQFVKWGERHHSQSDALHAAGEIFEARARAQASLLGWIAEPFVVILVGLSIGTIVLALFLPLIKLLNDLT